MMPMRLVAPFSGVSVPSTDVILSLWPAYVYQGRMETNVGRFWLQNEANRLVRMLALKPYSRIPSLTYFGGEGDLLE